jgi:predicted MFS family arabinose efflux permease
MTASEWLLSVLAAVQFTHIVDYMIVMPLGPVYISEMSLEPHEFGAIVAAYTISAGAAALIAAHRIDRFDRKSALLALYAGFSAGTWLCAIAPNYFCLLAARCVAGAFGGVAASVVLAIVGDAFRDERRGMATGVVMSAFSVASIAGVPIGIWLADVFGWHAPFAVLGTISVLVWCGAFMVLPRLRGHLGRELVRPTDTWTLLTDPNHVRAYALMVALVLSTFTVVPYLATYLVANVGLKQSELKLMYLVGGLATLLTMTYIGRLADRRGKYQVFRILAIATMATVALVTNLPAGLHLAAVLSATTLFMIASSGRMVPAMAMITVSAAPGERGGFLSLNSAVQQLACGLAAGIGGVMLSQADKDGPLTGFPQIGLLAGVASIASLILARRLRPAAGGELAPDSAVIETESML